MTKITATQTAALARIVAFYDDRCALNLRVHGVALQHGVAVTSGKGEVAPCYATLFALRRAGAIEMVVRAAHDYVVKPTAAGRALLASV